MTSVKEREAARPSEPADAEIITGSRDLALVELVSRVLDRGIVVTGDVVISVADVDLLYVRLELLLSSVESLRRSVEGRAGVIDGPPSASES